MNLDLIKKHIDDSISNVIVLKLAADGSNAQDFYSADVVGNKRFAQNFGGYPRSEIAEINAAATLEQQKALLNQLADFRGNDAQNAGLSDVAISLGHRSKYMQAPSEMQDYLEQQLAIRDAQRAEYARKVAESQAKKAGLKKVDVPNESKNE